jgi:phenylalanine-4-hydroxylase
MLCDDFSHGLTTTRAPFIEQAQTNGQIFIEQPYELYNADNQEAWRKLYARILPKWERYAHPRFLKGVEALSLPQDRVPRLDEVNAFLRPLTGFQAKAVSGYVPALTFFECLKRREFPTTVTIRDSRKLDYLPEPDIFHDVAGHVPMHTDPVFAEVLVKFGSFAEKVMENQLLALSRFFWFTVEFGLMRDGDRICAYGSGLLSSAGEIEHSVDSSSVQRYAFDLGKVIRQPFEIDSFQEVLFVIDSFEHLYDEVARLEKWLIEGRI